MCLSPSGTGETGPSSRLMKTCVYKYPHKQEPHLNFYLEKPPKIDSEITRTVSKSSSISSDICSSADVAIEGYSAKKPTIPGWVFCCILEPGLANLSIPIQDSFPSKVKSESHFEASPYTNIYSTSGFDILGVLVGSVFGHTLCRDTLLILSRLA